MSIYSQKQTWKLILFISAMMIVGASFWYTNTLVQEIAEDEKSKVRLWAGAIQKKANLVKYTNDLFKDISIEERKKVELWAEATKQLANANNMPDYTFVLKVVADNTTVPVILADDNHRVINHRNLDPELSADTNYVKQQMKLMERSRQPIEVSIYGDKKNYLYYADSRLFVELRVVLEDFTNSFISEVVVNSASVPVY